MWDRLWDDCDLPLLTVWSEATQWNDVPYELKSNRQDWFLVYSRDLHVDSLLYHWLMHIIIAVYFMYLDQKCEPSTLGLMHVCMWKLIRHLLHLWLYDCLWILMHWRKWWMSPKLPCTKLCTCQFFFRSHTNQIATSKLGANILATGYTVSALATILASNPGFLFQILSHSFGEKWPSSSIQLHENEYSGGNSGQLRTGNLAGLKGDWRNLGKKITQW